MGNIIASKCRLCDFENEFRFGGNRFDFKTNCPVPAINIETGEFVNINYKELEKDSAYLFYSDEKLKDINNNSNTINDFDLKLSSKNNYCPNCKNFTLDFNLKLLTD